MPKSRRYNLWGVQKWEDYKSKTLSTLKRRSQQTYTSRQISRQTSFSNNEVIDKWREETAGGGDREYSTHIIGGTRTNKNRFPYHVSIYTKVNGENYHVCGGTLIHDDFVLTAAHCAEHANFARIGAYTQPTSMDNGGAPFHDSAIEIKIPRKLLQQLTYFLFCLFLASCSLAS